MHNLQFPMSCVSNWGGSLAEEEKAKETGTIEITDTLKRTRVAPFDVCKFSNEVALLADRQQSRTDPVLRRNNLAALNMRSLKKSLIYFQMLETHGRMDHSHFQREV